MEQVAYPWWEKKGGKARLWSPDAYFALSVTLTSAHNVLEAPALPPSRRIESQPSKPNVAIAISSTCFPDIRPKPTTVVGVVNGAGVGNGGEKRCSVHERIRAAWRLLSSGKTQGGGGVAGVDDAETRLFSPEPAAHGEFGLAWLLLLLLPWRSNGSASAHATINVLLFLLRRFQNLQIQATDISFVYMTPGHHARCSASWGHGRRT